MSAILWTRSSPHVDTSRVSACTISQLENVAFNRCSINRRELRNIFHASRNSLKSLYLEYPTSLLADDLLHLLVYIGQGLRSLSVLNFSDGMLSAEFRRKRYIVESILFNCPRLVALNFPEAMAGINLPDALVGSQLRLWAFTCSEDVRPEHWLEAFAKPGFPRNASCRVYVNGWTTPEVRHVRIQAHKIGLNWLASGATLTDMCDALIF